MNRNTIRRWACLCATLIALTLASGASAQDNKRYDFDLAAQPLEQALEAFAEVTRRQVIANSTDLSGLQSNSVQGRFTAAEALEQLIAGAALRYSTLNGEDFALESVALAGGASPVSPYRLDEIIVRGELLTRSFLNTQTSVSVVTGAELDRGTDKDLFDTVDRLPNVNAQGGGFGFVIRGVADGGVGGGAAQAISVQIDGAAVPNGQALRTGALSTWDLEQVEVLRGPQSTQQGPNALAGAIVLRSQDPIFDNEFKVRADYGSFDETRLAAAVNIPLGEHWAFRFSAEDYSSDGDITNFWTGEDNASESLTTYRAKLRYQPDEALDMVLTYSSSENELGDQSIIDTMFPEERFANQLNSTIGETDFTTLRIDYDLGAQWSLASETGYLRSDYELFIGLQPEVPTNTPGGRTVDDTSTSQELKFLYDSGPARAVVGGYYQNFEKDLFFQAIIPDTSIFGLPPGSAVLGNTFDNETENYAVFGEIEFDLNDRWMLLGGLRYDNEQQDTVIANFSEFTPDPVGLSADPMPVAQDASYDAWLPKFGVVYSLTEDSTLGFTAQRAYRAGGAATDFQGTAYEYEPEYANNFELSYRSKLSGSSANLSANVFLTDYTDMQVGVPGDSGTFLDSRIENAGEATLWGFEVLFDIEPIDNLLMFANIGYTDTEFDEYIGGQGETPVDLSGNRFPQAPEWTGSVGGSYFWDQGFFVRLDANYTDSSFYTVNNVPEELNEPFTLVNAQFGYESRQGWTALVFGRNILDEQYLARKRADGFSSAGDSRVVGVSVTFSY
ncbi:MAG: TonB-dependent receptor [Pseudomonadota bacterium]